MTRTKTTIDRQVSETEKPAGLAGFLFLVGGDAGGEPSFATGVKENTVLFGSGVADLNRYEIQLSRHWRTPYRAFSHFWNPTFLKASVRYLPQLGFLAQNTSTTYVASAQIF